MTETLEQYRGRMAAELERANNEDLMREVKAVPRNRGWDFTRAWSFVLEQQPAFQRNAPGKAESAAAKDRSYAVIEAKAHKLIYESGSTLTMGEALSRARGDVVTGSDNPGAPKDPRIVKEMNLHKKISDTRQSDAVGDHVDRMARIRKLMQEKGWDFNRAFSQVCDEENATKKAPATATHPLTPSVKSSRDQAIEAANRKGMIYVEGGNCGLFCPLPGCGE